MMKSLQALPDVHSAPVSSRRAARIEPVVKEVLDGLDQETFAALQPLLDGTFADLHRRSRARLDVILRNIGDLPLEELSEAQGWLHFQHPIEAIDALSDYLQKLRGAYNLPPVD